jgi:hypothetical protein
MVIYMLAAADGEQPVGGSMAYLSDESRTRRNHGAMQFFFANQQSHSPTVVYP